MFDLAFERLLKRDRLIVLAALTTTTVLAWVYILQLARDMNMGAMDMTGFQMVSTGLHMAMAPASRPWTVGEFGLMLGMWTVMMIGMMTPSVAPLLLLYARVARHAETTGEAMAPTAWFALGYFLAWTLFAFVATTLQHELEAQALLTPEMRAVNSAFGGVVLIFAGLYQWSSLKDVCLEQCESPIKFLQRHGGFRRTASGACGLGLRHGLNCIGCCWVLMLLLFVGGVMTVPWIAAISVLVTLEKVTSIGSSIAKISGTAFLILGVYLLASG